MSDPKRMESTTGLSLAAGTGAPTPGQRPLITFAIRFHNCSGFVDPTLRGAFAQTYSPLEVLVFDDHSDDGTFALAERIVGAYRGPHAVRLFRNERTLGTGGQMENIRRRMSGEFLVIADGDDISLPNRVERICQAFLAGGPRLMGVDCHFDLIDEGGNLLTGIAPAIAGTRSDSSLIDAELVARGRAAPHGAVSAYRRLVVESGTPFSGLRHSEDRVLALRALLLGSLATIPQVLVHRRVHRHNVSGPISAGWAGDQLRDWFSEDLRRKLAVARTMRLDIAMLMSGDGGGAAARAKLFDAVRNYAREAKLLRVAARLGGRGFCLAYRGLRRLGIPRKDAARYALTQTVPSGAMMFLRRNPLIRSRAVSR